ncbi:aspartate/glutamate racemase family protein [Uliginosibacterium sp. TH139]|uniref:maleate cis-trans isomerase family protein n=1 Tax=Uliginosibacterium sp. TH139 TaxID=2067453 RepID=UPI000C7C85E8|nr:aspartate/glutamate racemase family protein [Uliginosibacterium sp. TH139]PLK48090.1 Asp/Glu/hydantoin racemase [Uliginosibacterium sp. TH139]
MSTPRTLLGILTPSSNTSLEPLTSALCAAAPGVSAHFARFPVTEISLKPLALGQFDDEKILAAARLLADAKVQCIGWSGTSSGWLGLEADRILCRRIEDATGIPATTSTLALKEIMEKTGRTTLGLVTPYLDDVQAKILSNFASEGMQCIAERHLGICVNFDFSEVSETQLSEMVAAVAAAKPEAITTFCTNLKAAHLAQAWETAHGIAIYDTVSTVVWKMLRMQGYDTTQITGWGRLFTEVQ